MRLDKRAEEKGTYRESERKEDERKGQTKIRTHPTIHGSCAGSQKSFFYQGATMLPI